MFFVPALVLLSFGAQSSYPQRGTDSLLQEATLENCVQYAMNHQPQIVQSQIDQRITEREIKDKLADWYPQIGVAASYTNNFQLQKSLFGNQPVNVGTYNTSTADFYLTQTIFNRDVLLARHSAQDVRNEARQITVNKSIDLAANVSKAFYDVLLSRQQIDVINEDIVLLQRSLRDAYNQYQGGLVDKTDYQRATISLNNALSQKKTDEEQLKSKVSVLKVLMSYPPSAGLEPVYDSTRMAREVATVDTLEQVDYTRRIEYQLLVTQKKLQQANLQYYKWAYLPSASLFAEYNLNYYNNELAPLFSNNYPNSYAGLSVTLPIFQGTKRQQEIRIAELQLNRLDYDFIAMRDSINSEYTQALAAYKSNLVNYEFQKSNLDLARQVYNVIQLQYRSGIKTYLDVITANNDLFLAQINFTNAIYQVLSDKVDVQRALGTLSY
jgi:outer membrane protein TolC